MRNLIKSIVLIVFVVFIFTSDYCFAQSTFVPLDKDYTDLIDRYEIVSGKWAESFNSSVKPYKRKSVVALADTILKNNKQLTQKDKFNLNYLINDSREWADTGISRDWESKKPFLKYLYAAKTDFYSYSDKVFDFHFNPVLDYEFGRESNVSEKRNLSSRGFEIRGMIAKKIGFYTFATDNSAFFPTYVQNYIKTKQVVPGEGYWQGKEYGTDWFTARGYFTCNIIKDYIDLQFGHDKNFIGNGYRSMLLSDYSTPYLFLKLNTKIWKFNYENIFAEMNSGGLKNGEVLADKKYFAFHHLSVNIGKHLNIGVSEAEVFGRGDSLGGGTFELNYLNPVIFLRPLESNIGSPDNAMIGIDFKFNFLKHFLLYGQIFIDEFVIDEIRHYNNGSWKNKEALQLGLKYIDVAGVSNLDYQIETNLATPYTYSHMSNFTSYTNFDQPLANPLGANFYEVINIIRYQPIPRLNLNAKSIISVIGYDDQTHFWGNDITRSYLTRVMDYENKLAQGNRATLYYTELSASYQIMHNLFADLSVIYRNQTSDVQRLKSKMTYTSLGIRWNIAKRRNEF